MRLQCPPLRVGCGLLSNIAPGSASAQMASGPAPKPPPAAAQAFPPPMNVYNGTRGDALHAPHLARTTEHVMLATPTLGPRVHGRHLGLRVSRSGQ